MSEILPTVSLGMPVYNGAKFLQESLRSLLNQTHRDFELIISDNDSTDETQKICESFMASDRRILYVRQEKNLGAAANYKKEFQLSRGKNFNGRHMMT